MKKHGKYRRIMKVFLGTAAAAAGALIVFLAIFYVPEDHAEVVGSIRYSDDEIRRMVFTGFREHNSLYLAFRKKVIDPGVYFISSIEVEYQGHNRVRLQVNEDMPIGYIEQDGYDYYFNSDGIVLEAILFSENDPMIQAAAAKSAAGTVSPDAAGPEAGEVSSDGTEQAEGALLPDSAGLAAGTVPSDGTEGSGAAGENLLDSEDVQAVEEQMAEAVADTGFHAALTDVTRIEGLTNQKLKVGSVIRLEDASVFHTILALTKIFSKFDLKPDYITYNDEKGLILHYADVKVNIGGEANLEAKLARCGVILPQLEGMQGTLHLENWTEDTVNIVFSPDTGEEEAAEPDAGEEAGASDGGELSDEEKRADAEEFYQYFLSQAPGYQEEG